MTPLEVYTIIYNTLKYRLLTINTLMSNDSASRIANKFAVKHTWEFYNEPHKLKEFTGKDMI